MIEHDLKILKQAHKKPVTKFVLETERRDGKLVSQKLTLYSGRKVVGEIAFFETPPQRPTPL